MPFTVEKLDLELAWQRVKADLRSARAFVHMPLEIELVDADTDAWLDYLREKIARGYRPHSAVVADVPKGNGAVRPAVLLCLEDRVVYFACVGAMLPALNTGLRWSQSCIDFSFPLSESVRRVEWFTNAFNGWSAFRSASLARIEGGAAHVVLTDITGFSENIDLAMLASDLRQLGCDPEVLQLLQNCLNRWCVVPGRGLPQALSPSDVLAKVFVNPVDQSLIDNEIDYIRCIDDIRMFCSSVPECKKALMFLTQTLRRRGLTLQAAKTAILTGQNARPRIEGITPIITGLLERCRNAITNMVEQVGPCATITEIEQHVDPDDPPLELVREVFHDHFLTERDHFNEILFHYLLNRLGAKRDTYAVDYCLRQFEAKPQEMQPILEYFSKLPAVDQVFLSIEDFLISEEFIYDFQGYQIFHWLNSLEVIPSPGLIAIARRLCFDNSRPGYLRAVCRIVVQKYGTTADLDRLETSYATAHDELEKAQILVSMQRTEMGRRNAFYGRVAGDGLMCERAIALVRAGRI